MSEERPGRRAGERRAEGSGGAEGAGVTGPPPPLEATGLRKSFPAGEGRTLDVLRGTDLTVSSGEAVAVVGKSGSGKSTLLHLLGALDRPSAGEVRVGGRPLAGLEPDALASVRSRDIGFVFQFHHLLREFDALENVMMPALIAGVGRTEAEDRATGLLREVGLAERMDHKPRQLSGGEQQRVAVARALVHRPLVLLADEPSGNLDQPTSDALHDVLFGLREERRLSMVLVTHSRELAARCDRVLRLTEGRLHREDAGTG